MKVTDLIRLWESESAGELAPEAYRVHLPLESVARIEALAEMFPPRAREQLICDLVGVALDQVVSSFPYIEGSEVMSTDEEGDPVYADVGHTPRYLDLVSKHMERLSREKAS